MQCRTGERPTHSGKTRLSEERDWRRLGLWLSWQGACGATGKSLGFIPSVSKRQPKVGLWWDKPRGCSQGLGLWKDTR